MTERCAFQRRADCWGGWVVIVCEQEASRAHAPPEPLEQQTGAPGAIGLRTVLLDGGEPHLARLQSALDAAPPVQRAAARGR